MTRFLIGTSGFAYPAWKGKFYPPKLPASEMLHFYAERFPAVEINNTFYRFPQAPVLAKWAVQVQPGFHFAVKCPASITHVARLAGTEEAVRSFDQVLGALQEKRGPVLFLLPPQLRKDVERLTGFLAVLPAGMRAAFEFRHPSWHDDAVFAALHAANAPMCISDRDEAATPWQPTADWGYLRLRRSDYPARRLSEWARRIESARWTQAHVFFKHEDEAKGPLFAQRFLGIVTPMRRSA